MAFYFLTDTFTSQGYRNLRQATKWARSYHKRHGCPIVVKDTTGAVHLRLGGLLTIHCCAV